MAEHVPCALIAPLIRRWIDEYRAEHDQNQEGKHYVDQPTESEGYLEVLAFRTGVGARTLRGIKNGMAYGAGTTRVDYIRFDTADKIVTAIDHTLWYKEPLKEFYGPLEVTHSELKRGYELPEGFDWDGLPTAKKYLWSNARMKSEVAA